MIFAVDFDGTLSYGEWPEVGIPNEGLISFLKKRKKLGDKLILWTCREGGTLDVAIEWCLSQGLEFDAINDNLPEVVEKYQWNSRKISCDFYIDDKAITEKMYKLFAEE